MQIERAGGKAGRLVCKKSSIGRILHQRGRRYGADLSPEQCLAGGGGAGVGGTERAYQMAHRLPERSFPTAMVHQNAELLQSDRLLTTDQWADYLIYCFYPRQKVFVDGRSDFYGETLGNQYLHLLQGGQRLASHSETAWL